MARASQAVIAKSCVGCRKWHSVCHPTFLVDAAGNSQLATCQRCKDRGIECIYALVKTRKRVNRTGTRIEAARARFGSLENENQDSSSFSSNLSLSRQDAIPSSRENQLRRHQRQGLLVFDLIRSFLDGIRLGFFPPTATYVTIRQWAVSNLTKSFQENGFQLGGNALGPYGDLHLAILCAAGSAISSHSAILGSNPSRFPRLPFEWFDSTFEIQKSNQTAPFRFPAGLDLRTYGLARQSAQNQLSQYCWHVFERHGFLEPSRNFQVVELKLFEQFRGLVYGKDGGEAEALRIALKLFKSIPIGISGGWESRQEQLSYFDGLLAADMMHSVLYARSPITSDEDILQFMADDQIPPKLFLSYDRATIPKIWDLNSHHQITWATYLSVERMMGIVAHSILHDDAKIDFEPMLRRMHFVLNDRDSWRRSTISTKVNDDGTLVIITPYGPEDPMLTSLDAASSAMCHFTLLRLFDHVRVERDPSLEETRAACVNICDGYISRIASTFQAESVTPFLYRRRLRTLEALPEGLGFLVGYLARSSNHAEYTERAEGIKSIWRWCKLLSFTGQVQLWQLLRLESLLGAQVENTTPVLSHEEIIDAIIQGALKDISRPPVN